MRGVTGHVATSLCFIVAENHVWVSTPNPPPPNPTPLFQHSPLIAQLDSLSKKKDRLDAHVRFARGLILYKNSLLVQYPFLDAFLDFLGMMRTGYNQV